MKSAFRIARYGILTAALACSGLMAQGSRDGSAQSGPNGNSGYGDRGPYGNGGGDSSFGWIGLLGLAGLAGLFRGSHRSGPVDTRDSSAR